MFTSSSSVLTPLTDWRRSLACSVRFRYTVALSLALGKAAATTEGNGVEVADWSRRTKVKRIIVVTSEYHMDRALLELQRAMPEGNFIPHAVMTTKVPPADWYKDTSTAKLLIDEWVKYRLASLRGATLDAGKPAAPFKLADPVRQAEEGQTE